MTAIRFTRGARERLGEDRLFAPVFQLQDFSVVEAPNAAVRPEVAVERAVLVDEDHAAGAASTRSSTLAGARASPRPPARLRPPPLAKDPCV
jgi:hypothetical protein